MSARIAVKVNGVWRSPGTAIGPGPVDPPVAGLQPARYTDTNLPWTLQPGESYLDNLPAAGQIVNASAYSTSTDLRVVLDAVIASGARGVYVFLDLHPRYFVNSFQLVQTNGYVAFHSTAVGNKAIMGLIGKGPTLTSVCLAPGAINATPGLRDFVLAANKTIGDMNVSVMQWSGSNQPVPFFMSGITFDGTLQGPYGVYNTTVQAQFNRNQTVPSPLAYTGMSIWYAPPGSRVQFCRFRGFGYALLNAPPFEKAPLATDRSNGLVIDRCEFDGRIAAEFDSTRHRASGGLMFNKDTDVTVRNSWLHHTRKSGWATNTNTGNTAERYTGENFQCHDITAFDEYASGNSVFPGSNIEEVVGIFKYRDVFFSTGTEQHMYLALPYSSANGLVVVPDRPIIDLQGFYTTDTQMGGCLRISVPKTPNSSGISPAWQKLTNLGIAACNLWTMRRSDGTPLVGVRSTNFNPAIHKPDTHFVVTYAN
jgi:hypothetical protein